MNKEESNKQTTDIGINGLPLKITGIVFWGMVLLGILASWVLIEVHSETLKDKDKLRLQSAALEVNRIFLANTHRDDKQLRLGMEKLLTQIGIEGLALEIEGRKLIFGNMVSSCEAKSSMVSLYRVDGKGGQKSLKNSKLTVCMPDTSKAVSSYRKNVVIFMAILFFSFGVVLQTILKKLLSEPFVQMVDTAKRIFEGQSEKRFNQARADEFGFLGKFINQVLDQQNKKSCELKAALEREQQADIALIEERERAEVTIQFLHEAVITIDQSLCIQTLNKSAEKMLGYSSENVKGRLIGDVVTFVDEQTKKLLDIPLGNCLESKDNGSIKVSCGLRCINGIEIDITISASAIKNYSGKVMGVVVVIQDVGIEREMERKLLYQASHDWLTSLYNRQEFEKRLHQFLQTAKKQRLEHVLCYMDLDRFKIVNDTCGHVAGDELIKQVANLFKLKTRDTDVLARLGGDEFGLILSGCSINKAKNFVERLRRNVEDYRFNWKGKAFEIGVSIGIVAINISTNSTAEVLSSADMACYTAKERGRNAIHVFEATDTDILRRAGEAQWLSKIKDALKEDRFCLYYQPIVPVDKKKQEKLHVEILLRMVDEEGAILSPGVFLPAAERYNLVARIDRWVIQKVFSSISSEMKSHYSNSITSKECLFNINLSGDSIGNLELLDFVKLNLQHYSIPPEVICFEITETAAISDMGNAIKFIEAMRALGCFFALDDFGNGMCSFSYLKVLPVDYLKIDGNFVKSMITKSIDKELVRAVNQVGHVLGMKTIAEFVENDEVRDALEIIGVDYAQGYGIKMPEPLTHLFESMKKFKSA